MEKYIALAILIVFLLILIILWYKGKKKELKRFIYSSVVLAEKIFGSGTGRYKYDYVIGLVYPKIPNILKPILTEKKIDELIEEAVTILKEKTCEENILVI